MLIRKKIIYFLAILFLIILFALVDLRRQQNIAENFATKQIAQIVTSESTLKKWNLPSELMGIKASRVDTNYAFSQWEIIFSLDNSGFIQMFVKPSKYIIIPVLNFEHDFEIERINFVKSG